MRSGEKKILEEIYNGFLETHITRYSLTVPKESEDFFSNISLLEEKGYITKISSSNHHIFVKLTSHGLTFVENNYSDPALTPTIQGSNNVIITGSRNTLSNSFNRISVDLETTDLPDDIKQQISSLLYEMNNPHLTDEKRKSKITDFLCDLTSGTLSGVATSALVFLLSKIFSK